MTFEGLGNDFLLLVFAALSCAPSMTPRRSFRRFAQKLKQLHLVNLIDHVLRTDLTFHPSVVFYIEGFVEDGGSAPRITHHHQLVLAIVWHHRFVQEGWFGFRRRLKLLKRFLELIPKSWHTIFVIPTSKELLLRLLHKIIDLTHRHSHGMCWSFSAIASSWIFLV